MRLQRRPLRAAVACLLGTVVVLGLTAVPASALGALISGVTIGGAHAEVNPGTPIWNVEIVVTGITGVNCTTLAAQGAELHYKIHVPDQGDDTDKLNLCPTGTTGPVTEARFLRPVVGANVTPVAPGQTIDMFGEVRFAAAGINTSLPQNNTKRLTGPVVMPLAPVWVAVGDGYTSALEQVPAFCATTDTTPACTQLDSQGSSWVAKAVQKLNTSQSVDGTDWAISYVNLAARGARAADLGLTSTQLTGLTSALAARAPAPGSGRPGSWNWVGVTAGIQDAGIIAAINSWYSRTGNAPTATSPNPWDVTTLATCPTLTGVPATVTSQTTAIQDGLLNTVAAALRADGNVRVVHPLYPYFAEATAQSDGYSSPCRTQVVDAVRSLDDVTTTTALANRLAARGDLADVSGMGGLGRAFDVDLRVGFDPFPTGIRQGAGANLVRVSSPIQLTKPYGYPYPSSLGADRIGNLVIGKIKSQEDPTPPTVSPAMERPADSNGWYNHAVSVNWVPFDPAGDNIPVRQTLVDDEGGHILTSPPDICSGYSGLCARQVTTQNVPVDMTSPVAGFAATDANGQDIAPNINGWFRQAVTLKWAFAANPAGRDGDGAVVSEFSGLDFSTLPQGTMATIANAANQTFAIPNDAMCDLAGNCASVVVPVNVDTIAPTVAGSTVPGTPTGGWFNATAATSVLAKWTATDNLSGIDGGPGSDVATAPVDISQSGIFTVNGPTFTDKAGNTTTGAPLTVKVDRVAPAVTLVGTLGSTVSDVLDGAIFSAATLPTTLSCSASDSGGSNLKGSCTAVLSDTQIVGGGTLFTYTVTATDNAGNVTTYPVHFTGDGVTTTNPPTVAGSVSSAPNVDGWYNRPVTITWRYDEGSPSAGISQAAKDAFNGAKTVVVATDGRNVSRTSPAICDLKAKCATPVTIKVNLDQVPPVITIKNVVNGAVYTGTSAPTAVCAGTDTLSGFNACTVSSTSTNLPSYGPPGKTYTVSASGTDYAGNVGNATAVTYTVFDITPVSSGRMTGSGKLSASSTDAEFTLRCNGSPNQLDVSWSGGEFDLTSITKIYCWDDARYSEGSPNAPIDSLWATGTGVLKNGKPATIEFTLTDQGEPGCGRDTLSFVIKDANGVVVLSSSGKLTGGGNVQAHDATGNGTNNNGHVNGPNGHYDGSGYDKSGYDRDGYDHDGYDHDGYDREGCDKRGYDRSGHRVKASWSGYDRYGRDDDGYDRSGYDSHGYNRSGYDKSGYDHSGYDREGEDRDGCDRNGYDERGVKRKYGSRR